MASYKYAAYILHPDADSFDVIHSPGTPTPFSGVYRCIICGREDVSTQGHPLPPQNHHRHDPQQGRIAWRLAVWADHKPK